jgi:hypothetical protein
MTYFDVVLLSFYAFHHSEQLPLITFLYSSSSSHSKLTFEVRNSNISPRTCTKVTQPHWTWRILTSCSWLPMLLSILSNFHYPYFFITPHLPTRKWLSKCKIVKNYPDTLKMKSLGSKPCMRKVLCYKLRKFHYAFLYLSLHPHYFISYVPSLFITLQTQTCMKWPD